MRRALKSTQAFWNAINSSALAIIFTSSVGFRPVNCRSSTLTSWAGSRSFTASSRPAPPKSTRRTEQRVATMWLAGALVTASGRQLTKRFARCYPSALSL